MSHWYLHLDSTTDAASTATAEYRLCHDKRAAGHVTVGTSVDIKFTSERDRRDWKQFAISQGSSDPSELLMFGLEMIRRCKSQGRYLHARKRNAEESKLDRRTLHNTFGRLPQVALHERPEVQQWLLDQGFLEVFTTEDGWRPLPGSELNTFVGYVMDKTYFSYTAYIQRLLPRAKPVKTERLNTWEDPAQLHNLQSLAAFLEHQPNPHRWNHTPRNQPGHTVTIQRFLLAAGWRGPIGNLRELLDQCMRELLLAGVAASAPKSERASDWYGYSVPPVEYDTALLFLASQLMLNRLGVEHDHAKLQRVAQQLRARAELPAREKLFTLDQWLLEVNFLDLPALRSKLLGKLGKAANGRNMDVFDDPPEQRKYPETLIHAVVIDYLTKLDRGWFLPLW